MQADGNRCIGGKIGGGTWRGWGSGREKCFEKGLRISYAPSPFQAAWAASALKDRLPLGETGREGSGAMGNVEVTRSGDVDFGWSPPGDGGLDGLRKQWEAGRAKEDAIREGSKELRDRFAGRCTALGQSPGGLPQEMREAMETLDKAGPWGAKVQAALALEVHLNKLAGKAGGAVVVAGTIAKSDPVVKERKGQLIKGLSGRFKKL